MLSSILSVAVDVVLITLVLALAASGLAVIFGLIVAATYRSIGLVGIAVGLALWGLLIWLAVAFVNLDWHSPQLWTWLAPFVAATLLTLGLRGSTIWRTLTGQVTVDTEQ